MSAQYPRVEQTRLLTEAQSPISDAEESGDGKLLARISSGEVRALGELYDRYAADVCHAAQCALRHANAEDVQSVVYETFISVCRLADEYDARTSCRSWLHDLAVLQARRHNCSARRLFRALRALVRTYAGRMRLFATPYGEEPHEEEGEVERKRIEAEEGCP
jgi:DNA-directed RNA polymerase specialized sigma24 family protein